MQSATTQRIMVGLSGGVDSAVSAWRLQRAGYEVVGAFIKVWHPDWLPCNWEAERLDAMRVAAHLGIPFVTCDAEDAYRDSVAATFITEYTAGRTPNPDVLCNQFVKFGAFLDCANDYGIAEIATGHYVRRVDTAAGPQLYRGVDASKDQSYFLWSLTGAQLAQARFPVGDTPKVDIRAEAAGAGLPVAEKRDSQGICFLGHVDIVSFLGHYTELTPGSVLDTTGRVIGEHSGALVYTVGQRHGFTITAPDTDRTAQYVVERSLADNTITVAAAPPELTAQSRIVLTQTVTRAPVVSGDTLTVQCRYRQAPIPARIEAWDSAGGEGVVVLEAAAAAPAVGQSCVLYREDHCLGGGIIAQV